MKESHKRSRNPAYKKKYRVTNCKEYEKSLRNRGNLTLWISPSAIKAWKATRSGKPGRQQKYSDLAIETVLILRLLFHLPFRQTEGFIESLFHLMKVRLPIPDHTTLSRRSKKLKPILGWDLNESWPQKGLCITCATFLHHLRQNGVVKVTIIRWERRSSIGGVVFYISSTLETKIIQ